VEDALILFGMLLSEQYTPMAFNRFRRPGDRSQRIQEQDAFKALDTANRDGEKNAEQMAEVRASVAKKLELIQQKGLAEGVWATDGRYTGKVTQITKKGDVMLRVGLRDTPFHPGSLTKVERQKK